MGKQKIDRLLAKLKDNHAQDVENAAAIFTVAQGAVNQLAQKVAEPIEALTQSDSPQKLTKSDLVSRYGNYNACRTAAKKAGITFSRQPRWPQIVAAFNYLESCQACIDDHLRQHPSPELQSVKLTLSLDAATRHS